MGGFIHNVADESYLGEWAKHGVLLLNTALTVRAHEVRSQSEFYSSQGGLACRQRMGDVYCRSVACRDRAIVTNRFGEPCAGSQGCRLHGMGRARAEDVRRSR
jgi:hypothetical protein